jgi:hypothetical protein
MKLERMTDALLIFLKIETNAAGVKLPKNAYAPQPNCQVNADATKGHAFGILMALGGTSRNLPPPCSP